LKIKAGEAKPPPFFFTKFYTYEQHPRRGINMIKITTIVGQPKGSDKLESIYLGTDLPKATSLFNELRSKDTGEWSEIHLIHKPMPRSRYQFPTVTIEQPIAPLKRAKKSKEAVL
jgi:hypothetical protein